MFLRRILLVSDIRATSRNFMNPKLIALVLSFHLSHQVQAQTDVVIYGGTAAAVTCAVQVKKMGGTVVVVSPDKHLGGLSSGGLGYTDTGNKAVIGGLARDFYHRIWKEYQKPDTWKWQKMESYGNKGQGTPAMDGSQKTMWIFEPHVAEKVFEDLVREYEIPLLREEFLDRARGVVLENGRIVSIRTLSGKTFQGKTFVDATYEGDLMAAARIDYHVGRESLAKYGEAWNGVQTGVLHHRHHFGKMHISPYKIEGDPRSGLLPKISPDHPGKYGEEDKKIQAYCFRMCLTRHDPNRVPFQKPENYNPGDYELLARVYARGWNETFDKYDPIPNLKTDTNNHGPFSTDNIGMNYDYPEASYERRREIIREHENYQKGWLYFVANDSRIPEKTRFEMQKWGLAKDEFKDNNHWPHQLYIREARRMVGDFVMTENELLAKKPTPAPIGMGSYTMDSHNVQRYVTPEGFVQNEGDIGVGLNPYQISLGAILPKKGQCGNLVVPVCVSSSHIAYGSIRMEPVFMILGQSAATVAMLAIRDSKMVQEVGYEKIRLKLLQDGQVLEFSGPPRKTNASEIKASSLAGLVMDNDHAECTGSWKNSSANQPFVGKDYLHEGNAGDGNSVATFRFQIKKTATYDVRVSYPHNDNRSTKVAIKILAPGVEKSFSLNQRLKPPIDNLLAKIATVTLREGQEAQVQVSNQGSDGYVVVDAVQILESMEKTGK
ncbi:MAG: FAD-dependent oxidoreductase [Planctomycetia bacterium]